MLGKDELARLKLVFKAFQRTTESIIITDRENRIVEVNPAFLSMTGYREEDILGHSPNIFSSGSTPHETFESMWSALSEIGHWHGEVVNRRADGVEFPAWLNISSARDEFGQVENYIASYTDISDRKAAAAELLHLAHHDLLTGLSNRVALESQMEHAFVCARRDGTQVAVLLLDMDNFKQVNDSLGHHIGDQLLIQIASRLRESVRASDIVARLGGDEFVVVLLDVDKVLSISTIASKLLRCLSDSYRVGAHTLYSTPSIGIGVYPADGDNWETLLKNADSAMYHAKSMGRSNFQFFEAKMNVAAHARLKLEIALRDALEVTSLHSTPQFRLYFQPQVDTLSGQIVSLEALARWVHPELGFVPPSTFIPIAEETGLIQPLGDWVFWEACRQLRHFKDAGIAGLRIAVNLSTQQLRHENLPVVIHGALACYDLAPNELELEITETAAMQNPAATIAILEDLKDMGIVLSIDDFGTGYSSLAYLKHLPIHRLKLDQSFVKDIDVDRNDAAICSATIVLGHSMGLDLVAEGVETTVQRDYLKELGCDLMQGFLYSHPLPADQIVNFVETWNRQIPAVNAAL